MAEIINHKIVFHCIHCDKKFERQATVSDYRGKIKMPIGWGYWRILSDFKEFCDNSECQTALNICTIGYQIDNLPLISNTVNRG